MARLVPTTLLVCGVPLTDEAFYAKYDLVPRATEGWPCPVFIAFATVRTALGS